MATLQLQRDQASPVKISDQHKTTTLLKTLSNNFILNDEVATPDSVGNDTLPTGSTMTTVKDITTTKVATSTEPVTIATTEPITSTEFVTMTTTSVPYTTSTGSGTTGQITDISTTGGLPRTNERPTTSTPAGRNQKVRRQDLNIMLYREGDVWSGCGEGVLDVEQVDNSFIYS